MSTFDFVYRVCTFFDLPFNAIRLSIVNPISWSYNPITKMVWALPRSLATTKGIINLFSSPLGTKMFQFPRLSQMCYVFTQVQSSITLIGFPHSDIFGSLSTYDSPKLFAVSYVLHQLLMPRHSPYALILFIISLKTVLLCFI